MGLNMRRRPQREMGVSGSENESTRLSSDMSPSDGDVRIRRRAALTGERKGGVSDGEGGRVKRRKKTWREREGEEDGARVPLSDGGAELGDDIRRRSWRLSATVMVPVEVESEKEKERAQRDKVDAESKEKEYARKQV